MLTTHLYEKLSELLPQDAKFAIAFSGGGDSTALLHALKDHPQKGPIYIVDHALRSGSDIEAEVAKTVAITCGYEAKVLKWHHNSPKTAIQEKARQGRYALLGQQCRMDGIEYLLTAHHQDDQAETLLMRYERQTSWRGAAGMAETVYGALWPELAMVHLVRPLLDISRPQLQAYNKAHDFGWSDDPSNENRGYSRIRARDYLAAHPELRDDLLDTAQALRGHLNFEKDFLRLQTHQLTRLDVNGIIYLSNICAPELMTHLLRAAGGQGQPIDRAKTKRLIESMRTEKFVSATLAGALVAKDKGGYIICRDPVAVKGRKDGSLKPMKLCRRIAPWPQIWDGRYSFTGPGHRNYMGAVHHSSDLLMDKHRAYLKTVPAVARPTLPVLKSENSIRGIGHFDFGSRSVKSLIRRRLEAALNGKID